MMGEAKVAIQRGNLPDGTKFIIIRIDPLPGFEDEMQTVMVGLSDAQFETLYRGGLDQEGFLLDPSTAKPMHQNSTSIH